MSNHRIVICAYIREHGAITKKQAVDLIGGHYFANATFHVGNVLSRMVGAGILARTKRGVFEIPTPKNTLL